MSVDTVGLTSEQVRAFRAADAAVFRWRAADGSNHGVLELCKDVTRADGFGTETLRVSIDCAAGIRNYGGSTYPDDPEGCALDRAVSGDWVLLSLSVRSEWHTIAAQLRAGDVLGQVWVVDNRNTLLKRARLTAHELTLTVERPTKDGRSKRLAFNLDACVCDPYSLADHVRREGSR